MTILNEVDAHPSADSYQASLRQRILRTLEAGGAEVIDFDLYAMKFEPKMGAEEWRGHDEPLASPPHDLKVYIDALKWAEICDAGLLFDGCVAHVGAVDLSPDRLHRRLICGAFVPGNGSRIGGNETP